MQLRAPAYPLVNVDPYFNLWLMADCPTQDDTRHWTDERNALYGTAEIDGKRYRFLGTGKDEPMQYLGVKVDALTTTFRFEQDGVALSAAFTTAFLPDQKEIFARPLSYAGVSVIFTDGRSHDVRVRFAASEEFVLDKPGDAPVLWETVQLGENLGCVRMGSAVQKKLTRSGDDLRIEWGYLYLAAEKAETSAFVEGGQRFIQIERPFADGETAAFALAYDDIDSLIYFGQPVKAWWKRNGTSIDEVIRVALREYDAIRRACDEFSAKLFADAKRVGGEKYAELCALAYRQSIGSHKLAAGPDGELLFVSKECFSNGCAATVDVSYPSIPQYLIYWPELVFGMMRPVLRYSYSEKWPFDFAPHDAGQYPLLNGNVYSGTDAKDQMPVEECGNLLIMAAAASRAVGNLDFCRPHMELFAQWVRYLEKYGDDPAEQLCTDDFAGHLAHNCNLSLKAIMGIAAYALLLEMDGKDGSAYIAKAREMAASWISRAAVGDGTFRLAFDRPESCSLKYNAVWDRWFGTNIFPENTFEAEVDSYIRKQNRYGVALDNRADYSKSDWIVWAACLTDSREKFEALVAPLWDFYNETTDRIPMGDWYETKTCLQVGYAETDGKKIGFQNRTVVGGLFMKLLIGE